MLWYCDSNLKLDCFVGGLNRRLKEVKALMRPG